MLIKKNIGECARGFTLIELVAFIVVVGLSITAIGSVFQYSVIRIQDPLINSHLLSMAQSQLDEVLSRKFDENTPTGGVPACGTSVPCIGIGNGIGLDADEDLTLINTLDDVDDFHLYADIPEVGYTRTISVVSAGVDFGVVNEQAKRITVTVTSPQGLAMSLTSYRFNF
jgi:MSHA pilin protein MshD